MGIRLLALDIDNTLIRNDQTISSENREAICRAQAAGVYVTLATGRGPLAASRVWETLDIRGTVIVYGGAMLFDTVCKRPVSLFSLDPGLISEILTYAHDHHFHAQIYQGDTVLFPAENTFTRRYTSRFGLPCREIPDMHMMRFTDVPKILFYAEEHTAILQNSLKERFGNRVQVTMSQPGFIEINDFHATKGKMLLKIASDIGISREETAAVGDNDLDLDMISLAGTGCCVENGNPLVRAQADVVAPSCEENGVAWFIYHEILGEFNHGLYRC